MRGGGGGGHGGEGQGRVRGGKWLGAVVRGQGGVHVMWIVKAATNEFSRSKVGMGMRGGEAVGALANQFFRSKVGICDKGGAGRWGEGGEWGGSGTKVWGKGKGGGAASATALSIERSSFYACHSL